MMREERRVCAVLFKRMDGYIRYAVLKRTLNWDGWELVKGHLDDADDDPAEAARREVSEETGIDDIVDVQPIDHTLEWTYEDEDEEVHAVCDCFLVEADRDAIIRVRENPHDEHETGHFLNYRDAVDILTYDNQRTLLEQAHERLEGAT